MSFLSLIPFKDWLYGGIIMALLIGFGVFVHHERNVGAAKIEAADAKVAAAAVQHNHDVQTIADNLTVTIGNTYAKAITAPLATPPPRVVCYKPPVSGGVPQGPGNPGSPDAAPGNGSQDPRDIGAPLTTVGRDADAQIKALQQMVQALVDEMNK